MNNIETKLLPTANLFKFKSTKVNYIIVFFCVPAYNSVDCVVVTGGGSSDKEVSDNSTSSALVD